MKRDNKYPVIDLLRFIAAIFVVAIHTKPFSDVNWVFYEMIQVCARLAVPFFFTLSGFFLFQKMDQGSEAKYVLLHYIKHIFQKYVTWSFIYVVYLFFSGRQWESAGKFAVFVYNYGKRFLFLGTSAHLWYMLALIWGTAIIFLFVILHKERVLYGISLVLYFVGVIVTAYYPLLPMGGGKILRSLHESAGFEMVRQYGFIPLAYLMLGWLLTKYRREYKKISLWMLIWGGVVYRGACGSPCINRHTGYYLFDSPVLLRCQYCNMGFQQEM